MNLSLELGEGGVLRCYVHSDCTCYHAASAVLIDFNGVRVFIDKDRVPQLVADLQEVCPPETPPAESAEAALPAFLRGYIEGLTAFAWWKDGVEYVGTCGTTLRSAIAKAKVDLCKATENPPAESAEAEKPVMKADDEKGIHDCRSCETAQRCSECGLLNGGASRTLCRAMGGYKPAAKPENPPAESAEAAAREVDGGSPTTRDDIACDPWLEGYLESLTARDAKKIAIEERPGGPTSEDN